MLGAEGKGLRQKTRETVTTLARLDMPGAIRSLNVSNAAAVSLYAATGILEAQLSRKRQAFAETTKRVPATNAGTRS